MAEIRGLLLDVDGTLVDSNDAHARAWEQAFRESGHPVEFDAIRPLIGMGGDKLVPKVSGLAADSAAGKAIGDRRGQIFLKQFAPNLRPCTGARALLELLKTIGFKLVVASSSKDKELKSILKVVAGESLIEDKTSSEDAENSKPDPDILDAALKKIGLPAEAVVMLGDTPYDIEAARRANVRVIALRCGGWGDEALAEADEIYDDPAALAAAIKSHGGQIFPGRD